MFYFCLLWQSWGCFKVRFPGDHCGSLPLRWESNLQMQNVQKRICKPEKTKPVCALFTAQGGKIFSANVLTFCGATWAYKHSPLLWFIASVSINFPASLTHIKVSVALMWQLNMRLCRTFLNISSYFSWTFAFCPASWWSVIGGGNLFPYRDLSATAIGRKFGFLCWMPNASLSVSVLSAVQTAHPSLCLPSPSTTLKWET